MLPGSVLVGSVLVGKWVGGSAGVQVEVDRTTRTGQDAFSTRYLPTDGEKT
ncbi:MAG: hypothetical protein ACI91Q_001937, partial [Gammaproteobacteria bacterium]